MKFRVSIEQDEDGVFVAEVPSLPGCISQGATRDDALKNIREAIVRYLESLRERNEPIPPPITDGFARQIAWAGNPAHAPRGRGVSIACKH